METNTTVTDNFFTPQNPGPPLSYIPLPNGWQPINTSRAINAGKIENRQFIFSDPNTITRLSYSYSFPFIETANLSNIKTVNVAISITNTGTNPSISLILTDNTTGPSQTVRINLGTGQTTINFSLSSFTNIDIRNITKVEFSINNASGSISSIGSTVLVSITTVSDSFKTNQLTPNSTINYVPPPNGWLPAFTARTVNDSTISGQVWNFTNRRTFTSELIYGSNVPLDLTSLNTIDVTNMNVTVLPVFGGSIELELVDTSGKNQIKSFKIVSTGQQQYSFVMDDFLFVDMYNIISIIFRVTGALGRIGLISSTTLNVILTWLEDHFITAQDPSINPLLRWIPLPNGWLPMSTRGVGAVQQILLFGFGISGGAWQLVGQLTDVNYILLYIASRGTAYDITNVSSIVLDNVNVSLTTAGKFPQISLTLFDGHTSFTVTRGASRNSRKIVFNMDEYRDHVNLHHITQFDFKTFNISGTIGSIISTFVDQNAIHYYVAYVSTFGNDSTGIAIPINSTVSIPTVPTDPKVFKTIDKAYSEIQKAITNSANKNLDPSKIITFSIDIPNNLTTYTSPYVGNLAEYKKISFEIINQAKTVAAAILRQTSSILFTNNDVKLTECQINNYVIQTNNTNQSLNIIDVADLSNCLLFDTQVIINGTLLFANMYATITSKFAQDNIFTKGANPNNAIICSINTINYEETTRSSTLFNNIAASIDGTLSNNISTISTSQNFVLCDTPQIFIMDSVRLSLFLANQSDPLVKNANSAIIDITNCDISSNVPVNFILTSNYTSKNNITQNMSFPKRNNQTVLATPKLTLVDENNDAVANYIQDGDQIRTTKTFFVPNIITDNYTVDDKEHIESTTYILDASANSIIFTLPSNQQDGYYVIIKRIDKSANDIIITAPEGTSIEGKEMYISDRSFCRKNKTLPKLTLLLYNSTFYIIGN